MGFFSKLFGKKENTAKVDIPKTDAAKADTVKAAPAKNLNELAAEKDARPAVTEKELMQYFAEYFAPNKDFYSVPGSEKYNAYFGAVNAARDEMIKHPDLFKMATKV